MQNLELKAHCENAEFAKEVALKIGATFEWTTKQTDTYFYVNDGKLKLREQEGDKAELIFYSRPEELQEKISDYFIAGSNEPGDLKKVLDKSLGVENVVEKDRTLYLWKNVRIHLDDVKHLGAFIEFEAAMESDQDLAPSKDRLLFLREQFKIKEKHLVSCGYLELLGKM